MPLLTSGEKLGPYEILDPLGEGGMGEVWKARDSRLNRFVAIKKSQGRFSERFAREAQAIAALNHPHICQIYDVGPDYLVMEYIEGKPLTGPLPVAQALEYAGQICDALDAAHRKGITHRDLKPGNILVGKTGVKILDFGLAKMEPAASAVENATVTMPLTGDGMVVGTLQYMSPEQIEGEEADARSDIFAFGLVLYEMLSGQRPFSGKSKTSLVASILKEQPRPLREIQPLTPPALERVVLTCLEKDPDKRWQSAREVKHALEWIQTESHASGSATFPVPAAAAAAVAASEKKSWLWPAIATVVVAIAVAGAWAVWMRPAAAVRTTRFQVTLPEGVQFDEYVSVSPDGRKLVFNATGAQSGLWIHDLNTLEWRKLAGTENALSPFWSPDSRFLGFSANGELKKIEVAGGPPQTLAAVRGAGTGAWSPDGVIVFGGRGRGPLRRVSSAGGVPTDVTAVDTAHGELFHSLPYFLPDGKHFLYLRQGSPAVAGIYSGSLDSKPEEQSKERILATILAAPYADGNLFFMRDGTLMVQPFDAGKLQLRGEPLPVAEHVATVLSTGIFSVSPTGVLAYRSGTSSGANFQGTWFDRQGKATGTVGDAAPAAGLALSPDGTRAAERDAAGPANGDIWLLEFARGVRTRLTFRQSAGSLPVWSPDGKRIIFAAGNLLDTLYEKDASGAGEEKELLKKADEIKQPTSWSRDGRFLLYDTANTPKTGADIWALPLTGQEAGDRKPVLLLGTEFMEGQAVFSPDGRWVAYTSNESGRNELYVRPFVASGSSGPSFGEGKWQVSRDGGSSPHWRNDGKEIVFRGLQGQGAMTAVDVSANGTAFQAGVPKVLFNPPPGINGVDVSGDAQRFLMLVSPGQQNTQTPITVVLNWQADLKR